MVSNKILSIIIFSCIFGVTLCEFQCYSCQDCNDPFDNTDVTMTVNCTTACYKTVFDSFLINNWDTRNSLFFRYNRGCSPKKCQETKITKCCDDDLCNSAQKLLNNHIALTTSLAVFYIIFKRF